MTEEAYRGKHRSGIGLYYMTEDGCRSACTEGRV